MDDPLSTVPLYCEMKAFIRPDSSLIWEGPSGQRITDGMEKYEIAFSDGLPNAAANGSLTLVPSRVSTLTITNLEPSDAGTYTCSINGTTEAVTMELMVNGTNRSRVDVVDTSTTSTIQTTSTTSVDNNATLQPTVIILSSLTAILTGLLVITVIATFSCLVHVRNKLRNSNTTIDTSNPAVYDYIQNHSHNDEAQPGELDSAATAIESDTSVRTRIYDEINDDLNTSAAHHMINDLTTTEKNVDHGMALSAIASEMNRACSMATDQIAIGVSESSANHGKGTDGIYSCNYLTTDADVPDSMMDQEKNETYYNGAYGVATDDFHTLESNISHDEAKGNVADAVMENNEAYGVPDAIMEKNVAYGVAIDGIGIDIMERNVAYGTAVLHEDSAGDTHIIVDDGDSDL